MAMPAFAGIAFIDKPIYFFGCIVALFRPLTHTFFVSETNELTLHSFV